jgi:RNA recognition motif-containing protein
MDSNTNDHANEELESQVYRIDYDPYSTEMAETKQEDTIIEDLELPWKRAAKDPSIIQKGTELFVGSLSIETEERDLYEMFKECGEVIDVMII